jgi:hypothetical protein
MAARFDLTGRSAQRIVRAARGYCRSFHRPHYTWESENSQGDSLVFRANFAKGIIEEN